MGENADINGHLQMKLSMLKLCSDEQIPLKLAPNDRSLLLNVGFYDPKGTSLHGTTSFDVLCRRFGCGQSEEPMRNEK